MRLILILGGLFLFLVVSALLPATALGQEPGEDESDPRASFARLPRDLWEDQKTFWIAPFRIRNQDEALRRTLLVGSSAWLLYADRPVGQELTDTPPGDLYAFGNAVETYGGGVADYSVAGVIWLVGKAADNERARATGVLGVRAVTGAMLVVGGMKFISQRPRPTPSGSGGLIRKHNADGQFFTGGSSFPSGHAAGAWAIGTVVAEQYKHRKWVPPVAYGLAGMVAVSRMAERAHFPTDVFVGSAIGFLIGRHVVRSRADGSGAGERSWLVEPMVLPGGGIGVRAEWAL